ncbi:sterol desaturase family protein [Roseibium sp. MMSF_3544]|uniref:sterol desaturase family protein n=1 Tax=unclassified Roseibium TaxID=2629323 RepID=UPI00273F79BB|nr:sterol desaturase family protein [Roseibium sp. MMSF_3544]
METILTPLSPDWLYELQTFIDDWFFVLALGFLAFEFLRYWIFRKLSWTLVGDTLTNYVTLGLFIGITFLVLGAFYVTAFYYVWQFAIFNIEINWVTVLICIVLADLVYYWEHRFLHRVNIGWATHSVHHSSPFFNISVAYRFGPMDSFWPVLFHLPLVLLGFNPIVVLFAEVVVQLYQTALHTEAVRKLPRPVEAIMNTPSHHRVHHGSNPDYLDKNYAGIFIIWDRMFGTFAEEKEKATYGLTQPINSVNPLVTFLHGFYRLARDVWKMHGILNKAGVLVNPPGWQPKRPSKSTSK